MSKKSKVLPGHPSNHPKPEDQALRDGQDDYFSDKQNNQATSAEQDEDNQAGPDST